MSAKKPMDTAEKAAWIGLAGVVIGALIAGVFGLIKLSDNSSGNAASVQTHTAITQTQTNKKTSIVSTPTGITSVTVTPTPTTQPASGSYTFDHELACNACANPIKITITQVTIDPVKENMSWTLKLTNRISTNAIFDFDTFTLTDSSGNSYPGSSSWIKNDLNYLIPPGKSTTGAIVIPFVPNKEATYTLDVAVKMNPGLIEFTPTPFTF